MSDKAFEAAMYQIANEAEAQQMRELDAAHRRQRWAKIRQRCVFVFGFIAFGCGIYFRHDVEQYASRLGDKFSASPKIDGQTAAALNDLKEGAAKRDKVLDEIAKAK